MPKDFFAAKKPQRLIADIVPLSKKEKSAPAKTAEKPLPKKKPKKPRSWRGLFILFLLILILVGAIYIALRVLPRLEIKIFLKKYPLTFNQTVEVSKNFATSTNNGLAGEMFSASSSLVMNFPASGKENVQRKAQGKITIYNSYSSDSQKLAAGTRFSTPDNKIFRLDKAVTVPGAKIQEGKIIASSIEVGVSADQPGAEYNIGPVAKFTIPGLKDTSKYEGFYGQSIQPMTGGSIDEVAVPTDQDIAAGQTKLHQALEANLKIVIFSRLPKDFKVLDGASEFKVIKKEIKKEVDQNNNFSIFAEAQMKLLTFREKDLKDVLFNQLKSQLSKGDYEMATFQIEYGTSRSDFEKGKMSFPIQGQITFQNKIEAGIIQQQARGQNEQQLKTNLIYNLLGLEKAQLSFWPLYVKTAPQDINKIKVIIQ